MEKALVSYLSPDVASSLNPLKAGVADLQQLKTNYLITHDTYFMSFFFTQKYHCRTW